MKVIFLAGILVASAATGGFACGPEFEEAPPTLDSYLDRLPQKPLDQIFAETSPAAAPVNEIDVTSKIREIAVEGKKRAHRETDQ